MSFPCGEVYPCECDACGPVVDVYLLPKGVFFSFAIIYIGYAPPAHAEIAGVTWRQFNGGRCMVGEWPTDRDLSIDDIICYTLVVAVPAHVRARFILPGWRNIHGMQVPPNTMFVNQIRDIPLAPLPETLMAQRQLSNLIADPTTPRRQRQDIQSPPGAPQRSRQRRAQPHRRNLRFEEDGDGLEPLDDDEQYDDFGSALAMGFAEQPAQPAILNLAADAVQAGVHRHFAADAMPAGAYVQVARPVRGIAWFPYQHRPVDNPPRDDALMNALAGRMLLEDEQQLLYEDVQAPPHPARLAYEQRGRDEEVEEDRQSKARRMAAALRSTTISKEERDAQCTVCANDYATTENGGDDTRVLRVSFMSCPHDLCAGCAHSLISGAVSHGRVECPVCRVPIDRVKTSVEECSDCIMKPAPIVTKTAITLIPCEHQCLCVSCAEARIESGDYQCPVCLFSAETWRAV